MVQVMDKMIASGDISPVIAVFVDNRNPYNPSDNRRNRQFWCNPDYSRFFEEELVPEIDTELKTNPSREARAILGLSFGGLNAACFGLQAHETFEGIAMQSPAMRPVPSIFADYEESPTLPLNIFLSTGTKQDNEDATRRLKSILEKKGYPLQYIEVPFSHDWRNWKPLLDDILLYFYADS
jgi:enterochelin esterase-like enzyme